MAEIHLALSDQARVIITPQRVHGTFDPQPGQYIRFSASLSMVCLEKIEGPRWVCIRSDALARVLLQVVRTASYDGEPVTLTFTDQIPRTDDIRSNAAGEYAPQRARGVPRTFTLDASILEIARSAPSVAGGFRPCGHGPS